MNQRYRKSSRHGRRRYRSCSAETFKASFKNRRLYRSRQGMVMGVCRGISDFFDIPVFWVRLLFVIVFLFSGLWPIIGIYIIASFIMKPKPAKPLENEDEQDFYDTYVHSREGAIRTLKSRFESLDRRIRRMEDAVTAREFDWDRRFNA